MFENKLIRHLFRFIAIFALCFSVAPQTIVAQTDSGNSLLPKALYDIKKPLVVVAFKSTNDLIDNIQGLLKRVGREDLNEKVTPKNLFSGNTEFLNYLTPEKPFGFVVYWDPAKANFIPNFCFYLPTEKHAELMEEIQWGGFRDNKGKADAKPMVQLKQSPDNTNLFINETDPDNGLCILKRDDYLLASNSEKLLTENPPQFAEISTGILRSYAAGVDLNPNGLPMIVRQTLLTFLKASAEGQLQQRDEESNAQFELRQTMQRRDLERLEMIINEAEYARAGIKITPDSAEANITGEIKGMPGTQFTKDIKKGFARNDIFSAIYKEEAIFSLNIATIMAEADMQQGRTVIKKVENVYKEYLGTEAVTTNIQTFFAALEELFKQDEFNAFLRFDNVEETEYAVLAGFNVPSAKDLNGGLQEMLDNLQFPLAEEKNIKVETSVDDHQGVTFHRLSIPGLSSEEATKFFGTEAALYIGAGQRTMWFCLGGTGGMRSMKTSMDDILAATGKRPGNADIKLNLHLQKLMSMPGARAPQKVKDSIKEWMTPDNDRITATLKSKEDTLVMDVELAEGLVKWISYNYANSVVNREKRQEEIKKRMEERRKKSSESVDKPAL
jgi:hypothetical protein